MLPFDRDAAVEPGTTIEYELAVTNVSDNPIGDIVLAPEIPAGTTYVGGSEQLGDGALLLQFSIDGGQTFRVPPIRYVVTDSNENELEMIATSDLYTDLRIALLRSLEPTEQVSFSYRVKVD